MRTSLLLSLFLLVTMAHPVFAIEDTQGPTVSAVSPSEAVYLVATRFSVEASDPSGVARCFLMVSSNRDTMQPMTYNATTRLWERSWTFETARTASSVRAVCEDTLGNEALGRPRVVTVIDAPIETPTGASTDVTTRPEIVDSTAWTRDEVIAASPVLIKTVCPGGEDVNHPCRAVYFLDRHGVRHAFPNEKAYFTWYHAFEDIHLVTDAIMASYPVGRNVRYRPGMRLVKFPSLNTVYAVSRRGVLRPVASEAVARALYGDTWNQQVDDISEAFFGNYTFGDPIVDASTFNRTAETEAVASINDNIE